MQSLLWGSSDKSFEVVHHINYNKSIVEAFNITFRFHIYFLKGYPNLLFLFSHRFFEVGNKHPFMNIRPNKNSFWQFSFWWMWKSFLTNIKTWIICWSLYDKRIFLGSINVLCRMFFMSSVDFFLTGHYFLYQCRFFALLLSI